MCEIFFAQVRMDYVLRRLKKKTISTVFGEGGKTFFWLQCRRVGTEARGLLVCVDLPSDCCVHSMHGTCTQ
jgi:hypothetical protein